MKQSSAPSLPTHFLAAVLLAASAVHVAAGSSAVNGTSGTPLGGFGAGAVKFNANDGSFAAMTRPPADAYDFRRLQGACFQLFVRRGDEESTVEVMKAVTDDGRPDDDAIWPLHLVNFGTIRQVEVRMAAFSPLDRTDPEAMSLPYAFYELTLTNTGDSKATAACALQLDLGERSATAVRGKGFTSPNWAVLASGDHARVTVGNGGDFLAGGAGNGRLGKGVNRVASQIELDPGESERIRIVLAWYDDTDPENCHYLGSHKEPGGIAELGLQRFDALKANAHGLAERMRASNLPDWLVNQTLNTLANLTTNSMYKRDGRVAFAEGQWTCFGTMDQMWHARQIVGQLIPFFAWEELRYWARTQRKDGQIHHDFNLMKAPSKEERSALVGWDDTEHADYRNIDKWVDLNCGFILSTYETYRITGDRRRLDSLWPHLKRAGQRTFDQVEAYGSKDYPFTFDHSENSYDAGGDPNPFNASLSAVAYLAMADLATERGETRLAKTYRKAYETVVESYRRRYLEPGFEIGKHAEGYFAGQWLALHLKLGEIWTAAETDRVLEQLNACYHPFHRGLGNLDGTYDEWSPYILVHYAGLLLNTARASQWRAMQHDAYLRWYHDRENVFNHPLDILPAVEKPRWTSKRPDSGRQYISLPGLWRNYYDLIGYHRDARTKELWLTPVLPGEMDHVMTRALYLSPEGDGTIRCRESGSAFQDREIVFQPEHPTQVRGVHLSDRYGETVAVEINGEPRPFQRSGSGYARELVVDWTGTVGKDGLRVVVTGDPGDPPPPAPEPPADSSPATATAKERVDAFAVIPAAEAPKSAGTRVVETDGVRHVGSCNNFDYLRFDQVDFGEQGAAGFAARVRSLAEGATLEIVLDRVSGESIGSCAIPPPDHPAIWSEAACPIRPTTGIHDVILRFFGSSADSLMDLESIRFTASAPGKRFDPATDLLSLHYDHAPDQDDGHSAAADRTLLESLHGRDWCTAHVLAVSGAYGKNAATFNPASDAVMDAVWNPAGGWLDAHADREKAVAALTQRWKETLGNGGDVWVKEGGQSDLTAEVVRRLTADMPDLDPGERIHVVQHSDWNENETGDEALAEVKSRTDYIRIEDANRYLNVEGGNEAFQRAALAHPDFGPAWKAAFDYYDPGQRLDFSDTGELLHILGLGEVGVEAFAKRYLGVGEGR